jgi:hypothetical protein
MSSTVDLAWATLLVTGDYNQIVHGGHGLSSDCIGTRQCKEAIDLTVLAFGLAENIARS